MTGGFTGATAIPPIERPMLVPSPAFAEVKKKKKAKVREEALVLVDRLLGSRNKIQR